MDQLALSYETLVGCIQQIDTQCLSDRQRFVHDEM